MNMFQCTLYESYKVFECNRIFNSDIETGQEYIFHRIGFGKMRNYASRLEAKIIFDGEVNSRLFPILMRIIVSSAFGALHAV